MRKLYLHSLFFRSPGAQQFPRQDRFLSLAPTPWGRKTDVEFLPAGPAEGATQREILDGFISAGTAPQNNFRIAPEFLTDDAALRWSPSKGTMVRGTYDAVKVISATEMTYSTVVVSVGRRKRRDD